MQNSSTKHRLFALAQAICQNAKSFVTVVVTVPKGTLGANDEAVWQKDKFFVIVLPIFPLYDSIYN